MAQEKQALGSEFTDAQLNYAPLAGAAVGGLGGAIFSKKKNMLRNALIGAASGGLAGGLGAAGYRHGAQPWNMQERVDRALLNTKELRDYAAGWSGFRSSNDDDTARQMQDALANNIFHARGLGLGALGVAGGLGAGGLMAAVAPNDDDEQTQARKQVAQEKQALGSEFTDAQLNYAPLAGAAFGGLTGAIASKKKDVLRNAIIGAAAGGAGGYLGAAGYRYGVKPWDWNERATRTILQVPRLPDEDPVKDIVANNLFHGRGLALGGLGALGGSFIGDALRASVPKEEEDTKTHKKAEQTMSDFAEGLHEGRALERSGMQDAMGNIGTIGAGTGLAYELLRKKTEEEKKQQLGEKVMRYLGRAGQGALMGAGTGAGLFAFKHAEDANAASKAKPMHVYEAGEKSQDVTPTQTETQHKEEVLTGNLGQKAAQALRIIQEKQALVGTAIGTVGGALTGDKGKRLRSTVRGFAKGLGTDVGMGSGAMLGGGLGGIAGGLATLPLAGIGAIPGAALGGLGGALAGGRMGYGITNSLLGPYKSDSEKFKEQMMQFLAAQKSAPAADDNASDKKPEAKKEKTEDSAEKKSADEDPQQNASAKERADALLNMDSGGGMLADLVTPGHWGGTRAGRATQISRALGKEPSFRVRHPLTSGWMSGLGGAGMGALGGAALGGFGGLAKTLLDGDSIGGGAFSNNTANLAALGAAMGGLGGYGGGVAHNYINKRKDMAGIRDALENELAQNGGANINPQRPSFGLASSFLLPASGSHRAGQADAYQALKGNKPYASDVGRNLAYGAEFLPNVGGLATIPRGIVQNLNARSRTREDEAPVQKAAAGVTKTSARGDSTMKLEQRYKNQLGGSHEGLFGRITPSNAEDFQSGGRYARLASDSTDQHKKDVRHLTQRRLTNKDTLRTINKYEKTSARGDATMRAEHLNNVRAARPDAEHARVIEHKPEDYGPKSTYRRAGAGASDTRKKIVSDAAARTKMLHERDKEYRAKSASAFDFGAKQAGFVDDVMAQSVGRMRGQTAGGLAGLAGGGALGALYGAYDPGAKAVLDENGKPVLKRRSRIMSALRGGVQGGLLGGLAGNVAGGAIGGYMARPAAAQVKAAFNFGVKMAEGNPAMPFTREGYNQVGASSLGGSVGLLGGGAAGAGLGALHGLISPGEVVSRDENGQPIVKKRNRLMGALRGGLGGGVGGALGGMALGMGGGALTEKYRPGTLAQLMPAAQKSLTDTYDRLSTAK